MAGTVRKQPEQKTTIGEIVKEALSTRGMSQGELAEMIGYGTQSAVSERLRGDIRVGKLLKMLDLIGYDIVIRDRNDKGREWTVQEIPTRDAAE